MLLLLSQLIPAVTDPTIITLPATAVACVCPVLPFFLADGARGITTVRHHARVGFVVSAHYRVISPNTPTTCVTNDIIAASRISPSSTVVPTATDGSNCNQQLLLQNLLLL